MENKFEFDGMNVSFEESQLSAAIQTLESDRKRIAHELHNDISSKLNVVSLHCQLLKLPNLGAKEIEDITKTIIEYTSKALDVSNRMTHSLLPPVLEKFGLHAGIEELCEEWRNNGSLQIQYENRLHFDFEKKDRHIHIFRILQELLANSVEHGKATYISILFDVINGKESCLYSDNGIGFDLNQTKRQKGLGLKNIAGRISILRGSITLDTQLEKGISVIFNF